MVHRKPNDALTIREIEYSILVKDKNKCFEEVIDILNSELTRFEDTRKRTAKQENPIHEFLKTNIERSNIIRDNTMVYFVNYHENGSSTIKFTVLLITRYINYGSTRKALDYLIKDTIGDYFEELLERHLPVSVSVHSVDTELFEIPGSQDMNHIKPRAKHDYFAIILASIALLITMTLSFVWYSTKNQSTEATLPASEYRDKYIELLIEKKVNEAVIKEKQNIILYKNLLSASDTNQAKLSENK